MHHSYIDPVSPLLGGTGENLLLGERHQLAALEDHVHALDGAGGGECPAAAALALVLDTCNQKHKR